MLLMLMKMTKYWAESREEADWPFRKPWQTTEWLTPVIILPPTPLDCCWFSTQAKVTFVFQHAPRLLLFCFKPKAWDSTLTEPSWLNKSLSKKKRDWKRSTLYNQQWISKTTFQQSQEVQRPSSNSSSILAKNKNLSYSLSFGPKANIEIWFGKQNDFIANVAQS